MMRDLYRWLIGLHPRFFRERFAEEMLGIFDHVSGPRARAALFGDALVSLFRQWVFRPEFRQPAIIAAAPSGTPDIPIFRSLDDYSPRPAALFHGAFLSVAALCGVVLAIGHAGSGRRIFLIGAHQPSPHIFPLDLSSFEEGDLNTVVAIGAEAEDPWQAFAAAYFKIVLVLGALDSDRDLIISTREIVAAPAALRKLDIDHDGKLSPEECGFSLGGDSERLDPQFIKNAQLEFMRANPALAALDADHDGEISAAEISNGAAALRTLDKNGDKNLSPREVLPDRTANEAGLILSRLDLQDLRFRTGKRSREAIAGSYRKRRPGSRRRHHSG